VKKSLKLSLGSVVVAGALGAVLIPAVSASASVAPGCAATDDAIDVPYAFAADGTPELAGTVCVFAGTTQFDSVDITPGWQAQVKASGSGSSARTEVRFSNPTTNDRVELRYEPGRTEIK
jgi:hypothetical protein